jgi:hypothetical protein
VPLRDRVEQCAVVTLVLPGSRTGHGSSLVGRPNRETVQWIPAGHIVRLG